MPRYIKIYLDDRRRKRYKEKDFRSTRLRIYLGYILKEPQIRLFKTYCQLTGASKSVYSQFALSRHSLRKHANFGSIPGVKPSSW